MDCWFSRNENWHCSGGNEKAGLSLGHQRPHNYQPGIGQLSPPLRSHLLHRCDHDHIPLNAKHLDLLSALDELTIADRIHAQPGEIDSPRGP